MNKVERHVFLSHGADITSLKEAYRLSLHFSKQYQEDVILYFPTKTNLETPIILNIFGKKNIKALKGNTRIKINQNNYLSLKTKSTFHNEISSTIILGIYVDKKMLNILDNCINAKAIIVVPWHIPEVEFWINRWQPIIHKGPTYK